MRSELSFEGRSVGFYDLESASWRQMRRMEVEGGYITAFDARGQEGGEARFELYMLPGFIDAHCHLLENPYHNEPSCELVCDEDVLYQRALRNVCDALAGGTTTVKDLGGRGFSSAAIAARLNDSMPVNVFTSGCYFTSAGGHCHDRGAVVVSSLSEFETGMEALRELRVPFCKIVHGDNGFSRDMLTAMVSSAHENGMLVSCHAYTEKAAADAVSAGTDILEHAGDYSDDLITEIRERRVIIVPTYVSAYDSTPCNCDGLSDVDGSVIEEWYNGERAVIPKLFSRGVQVALGSDAGYEGTPFGSVAREIRLLNKIEGIGVHDLMKSAFAITPKTIGLEREMGKIDVGYRADFQLFDADPIADPAHIGFPVEVWVSGKRVRLDAESRAVDELDAEE